MKSLFKSKTFLLACLQCAIAIVTIFTTQYPELQAVGGILVIKSCLDIFLRTITTQEVSI